MVRLVTIFALCFRISYFSFKCSFIAHPSPQTEVMILNGESDNFLFLGYGEFDLPLGCRVDSIASL